MSILVSTQWTSAPHGQQHRTSFAEYLRLSWGNERRRSNPWDLTKNSWGWFFTAIEIFWIKDKKIREKAKKWLVASHLAITYGAQPRLLVKKLNL